MSEVFDSARFWPAFKAAGLLKLATVKMRAGGPAVDVWVGYVEPENARLDSEGRSKDYEIEYQKSDLPKLAEGDQVTIWTDKSKTTIFGKFKVRESPFVPPLAVEGNDGFFRRALLTKA